MINTEGATIRFDVFCFFFCFWEIFTFNQMHYVEVHQHISVSTFDSALSVWWWILFMRKFGVFPLVGCDMFDWCCTLLVESERETTLHYTRTQESASEVRRPAWRIRMNFHVEPIGWIVKCITFRTNPKIEVKKSFVIRCRWRLHWRELFSAVDQPPQCFCLRSVCLFVRSPANAMRRVHSAMATRLLMVSYRAARRQTQIKFAGDACCLCLSAASASVSRCSPLAGALHTRACCLSFKYCNIWCVRVNEASFGHAIRWRPRYNYMPNDRLECLATRANGENICTQRSFGGCRRKYFWFKCNGTFLSHIIRCYRFCFFSAGATIAAASESESQHSRTNDSTNE